MLATIVAISLAFDATRFMLIRCLFSPLMLAIMLMLLAYCYAATRYDTR